MSTVFESVGGCDVAINKFGALDSLSLLHRLGKLVGPAIGHLQNLDLQGDVSSLAAVIQGVFAGATTDEVVKLPALILRRTSITIDGTRHDLTSDAAIDRAFSGKLMLLFQVMAVTLKTNYADFFGELLTAAGMQRK